MVMNAKVSDRKESESSRGSEQLDPRDDDRDDTSVHSYLR